MHDVVVIEAIYEAAKQNCAVPIHIPEIAARPAS
jgi:hypothetical protein